MWDWSTTTLVIGYSQKNDFSNIQISGGISTDINSPTAMATFYDNSSYATGSINWNAVGMAEQNEYLFKQEQVFVFIFIKIN